MSVWTTVSGSIGFDKDPYIISKNEDGSMKFYKTGEFKGMIQQKLPYPEEQFFLNKPDPYYDDEKKTPGFRFDVEITSFPLIKREINELVQGLPSGEDDIIGCSLAEENYPRCSSSNFSSPQTEKLFRETVLKYFSYWEGISWEEQVDACPTVLDFEHQTEGAVLTIHDNIRYCHAKEFHESFMNFLTKLVEKDYLIDHGSFTYSDYQETYYVNISNTHICVTHQTLDENGMPKDADYEYYQIFQFKNHSTKDKWFPVKYTLRKVDSLDTGGIYPEIEEQGKSLFFFC